MDQITTQNPQTLELLKGTFQLLQLETFFDSDTSDPAFLKNLWVKPKKCHTTGLNENILTEGPMEKQGRRTNQWKTRYYILTSNFLAYKEKLNSKTIKRIMLFDRVKLEYIASNSKDEVARYGFRFEKNQQFCKIYTCSVAIYQSFKTDLNRRCILNTFQENYNVEKLIATGDFGKVNMLHLEFEYKHIKVYLVKNKESSKNYAAKMFFKDTLLRQRKGKESLLNELRILRSLNHPGIIQFYEVHETMISVFLIMEVLVGGELLERLDEKRYYSEDDCISMLRKMIEPLAYMHSKGIMHRDITPENLILRSKNSIFDIVIADFGLAHELDQKAVHYRCGTPGFCAPEILATKENKINYTTKCDVFSVGCVFYYMVVGRSPFADRFQQEVYDQNKKCEISFNEPRIKLLSPESQALLKKMLSKDVNERPSLAECLDYEIFEETNKLSDTAMFCFARQIVPLDSGKSNCKALDRERFEGFDKNERMIENDPHFVVGGVNLIRGKTETIIELDPYEKMKSKPTVDDNKFLATLKFETKHSLLSPMTAQISLYNPPFKTTPRSGAPITSQGSEYLDENEENIVASRPEFPIEMGIKIKSLTNEGVVRNPFATYVV